MWTTILILMFCSLVQGMVGFAYSLFAVPLLLLAGYSLSEAVAMALLSPFTAVAGLADGNSGYCPTMEAVIGGGYSAKPIRWTRFKPECGYQMVDCASRLLREAFGD